MRDQTRRPVSCVSTRKQALGGMGWDGMGWDSMVWYGMGWDGMKWDEMGRPKRCSPSMDLYIYRSLMYVKISRTQPITLPKFYPLFETLQKSSRSTIRNTGKLY
ncbi:hypothetical protein HZH68_014635 [Vespula germanica]|uniref:Uncharacterized protein n=1 Tax=Vespula germanica TaxID=30212 RepID=A0A834J8G9_VESGE|nr:hypothetical protein HZH68_014635 [Vespula germanica]